MFSTRKNPTISLLKFLSLGRSIFSDLGKLNDDLTNLKPHPHNAALTRRFDARRPLQEYGFKRQKFG